MRPAVQGVIYKTFTRYTVREIFSSKRADIQAQIEAELKPRLAADGILLRSVQMGQVDLPAEYRAGLDGLGARARCCEGHCGQDRAGGKSERRPHERVWHVDAPPW